MIAFCEIFAYEFIGEFVIDGTPRVYRIIRDEVIAHFPRKVFDPYLSIRGVLHDEIRVPNQNPRHALIVVPILLSTLFNERFVPLKTWVHSRY